MREELKPCPWCESTHGTHFEGRPTLLGTEWRLVHSTERCLMRVETEWYRSRDEAVDAWNRRAEPVYAKVKLPDETKQRIERMVERMVHDEVAKRERRSEQ